jgi:Plavaka transposase
LLILRVQSSRLFIINTGIPCNENGDNLPDPPPAPPAPLPPDGQDPTSWEPFGSRLDFDFAHYHFVEVQSSAGAINTALDMWQAAVLKHGENVPWTNAQDLYDTIDSIQLGDAPWKVHKISYQGPRPPGTPPKWMTEKYELCTRDSRLILNNQLASSEFKGETNFVPYQQFNGEGKRIWSNLMSADWAWKQAVRLTQFFIFKKSIQ